MEALILALELRNKYNQLPLETVVKEFEEYTYQTVPPEAIKEFIFTGLNNVDFLTSGWLNKYGLKNLLQRNTGNFDGTRVTIREWIHDNDLSSRLFNVMRATFLCEGSNLTYIDEVTIEMFKRVRGFGATSLSEFKQIMEETGYKIK